MSDTSIKRLGKNMSVNKLVLLHFFLAVGLALLILPVFILTDAAAAFDTAMTADGIFTSFVLKAAGVNISGETVNLIFYCGGTIGTLIVAIVLIVISKGTLAFTPQAAAPYVDSTVSLKTLTA